MAKKVLSLILIFIMLSLSFTTVSFADTETIEEHFDKRGSYEFSTVEFPIPDAKDDSCLRKRAHNYKIWYPSELENSEESYPLIIYCNGTGTTYNVGDTEREIGLLEHIASWGYIVLANDDEWSGNGDSASSGLDFILKLNDDSSSIFYKKINVDCIGVAGHSQGGSGAINMSSVGKYHNSNMISSLYAASAPHSDLAASVWQKTPYDASLVQCPALLVAGTGTFDAGNNDGKSGICPLELSLHANQAAMQNDLVLVARLKDTDHGIMLDAGKGYMIAWFNYTLLGDEYSAGAFVGDNAEIFNNVRWQDAQTKQDNDYHKPDSESDSKIKGFFSNLIDKIKLIYNDILNALRNIFKVK